MSRSGREYGTDYREIFTSGNIKFVAKVSHDSEAIMETMTKGRVYVVVGGTDLMRIIYFDTHNRRIKQVDLDHPHEGMRKHTHHGYNHNEDDGPKGATGPAAKEWAMIERVRRLWADYLSRTSR